SSDERGAEVVEAGDLGGPSGEEAGVDESGDGRADRDGGDDGDAEDGAGVSCREGASWLGDEDDAVRPEVGEGDEGVATPVSGQRLDGGCAPGVDDGHGVARAFQAGDGEARSGGEGMVGSRQRTGGAEESGHGSRVVGEQTRWGVAGSVKGEGGGDGRCARAAAGADEGDGRGHGVLLRGGQCWSSDLGAEVRGGGESDSADAVADAGWGRDGVAVSQGRSLEAEPVEADDPRGGEVDDGRAGGGVDQADVAGAARGDAVASGSADAARPGDDPVAWGQFEAGGGDGRAGEPSGGAEGRAGEEVQIAGFAPGGGEQNKLVGRAWE